MITSLCSPGKLEDRICMSFLFSDVHSLKYRARGGRAENVSIAAFDKGKNLVFTNLFPVVGSHIWVFTVLITMASKHISSAMIPTKKTKQNCFFSTLQPIKKHLRVKVLLAQHVPEIKNRTHFKR